MEDCAVHSHLNTTDTYESFHFCNNFLFYLKKSEELS
jgi:hypothetical protein